MKLLLNTILILWSIKCLKIVKIIKLKTPSNTLQQFSVTVTFKTTGNREGFEILDKATVVEQLRTCCIFGFHGIVYSLVLCFL